MKRIGIVCLTGLIALIVCGCQGRVKPDTNLIADDGRENRLVTINQE